MNYPKPNRLRPWFWELDILERLSSEFLLRVPVSCQVRLQSSGGQTELVSEAGCRGGAEPAAGQSTHTGSAQHRVSGNLGFLGGPQGSKPCIPRSKAETAWCPTARPRRYSALLPPQLGQCSRWPAQTHKQGHRPLLSVGKMSKKDIWAYFKTSTGFLQRWELN